MKAQPRNTDMPKSTTDPAKIPGKDTINEATPTEDQLWNQLGVSPSGLDMSVGAGGPGGILGGGGFGGIPGIGGFGIGGLGGILGGRSLGGFTDPSAFCGQYPAACLAVLNAAAKGWGVASPDYVTAELTLTKTINIPLWYSSGKVQVGTKTTLRCVPTTIMAPPICTEVEVPDYRRVNGSWNKKTVTVSVVIAATVTRDGKLFGSVGVPIPQGKEGDPPATLAVRAGFLLGPHNSTTDIDGFVGGGGWSGGVNVGHRSVGFATSGTPDDWWLSQDAIELGWTSSTEPGWGVSFAWAWQIPTSDVPGGKIPSW